jgi:hypothetical protein
MLKALAPVITDQARAQAILEKFWRDQIALVWDISQVHQAANEKGTVLSQAQARRILQKLLHTYNPQDGISWQTLTETILDSGLGRNIRPRELRQFINHNLIAVDRK